MGQSVYFIANEPVPNTGEKDPWLHSAVPAAGMVDAGVRNQICSRQQADCTYTHAIRQSSFNEFFLHI